MMRAALGNRRAKRPHAAAASRGFTLLEVILALAIFAGSLAAMGEIVRLANLNSQQASSNTVAQMAAQSIMAEVLVGIRELEPEDNALYMIRENQYLAFSIMIEPGALAELVQIRVRVWHNDRNDGPYFDLIRWIVDPEYLTSLTESASS